MARKNIFEIISGTFDLKQELQRIKRLFEEERPINAFGKGCY